MAWGCVGCLRLQSDPGKLGSPKPDQCRSGVRGVFFDKEAPNTPQLKTSATRLAVEIR